jgi:C1A family cysteine protease
VAKRSTDRTGVQWEEQMSAFGGHPLHLHVAPLRAAAAGAEPEVGGGLAELGITDAEQLVALANRDETRNQLAATLEITKQELDTVVKEAKKVLPAPLALELEHPLPPIFALGAIEPPEGVPPPDETAAGLAEAVALAPSVNLISHMSPIRNQGSRGTCVAFTLTAIDEYFRRVRGAAVDLSEQHLYHEIKLIDGSPAVCGTWQRVGAQVLSSRGQCRAAVWPYNPNPPCNNNGVMPANARADALNYKLSLVALTATNVAAIKSALSGRRPVGISIPVYNSWYLSPETKRSGRITMPLTNDTQAGGHALCLAGYQDEASAPGGGYFIVRNHWHTTWGYQCPYGQGYGTIP